MITDKDREKLANDYAERITAHMPETLDKNFIKSSLKMAFN